MTLKKISLVSCVLLLLNSCYLSTINKEFTVENDEHVPLTNAKIYMLCNNDPYIFDVDYWFLDMETGKSFSATSDKNGKVKIETRLYFPGNFDLFVILPGYHPTMLPLKTGDSHITLLSEKRFHTEFVKDEDHIRRQKLVFRNGSQVLPGIKYSDMLDAYFRDYIERSYVYGINRRIGESKEEARRNNQFNIYKSRKHTSGIFNQNNLLIIGYDISTEKP